MWMLVLLAFAATSGTGTSLELTDDLDGDGRPETVEVWIGTMGFGLTQGAATFDGRGEYLTGEAFLVDVDTTDTFLEILIPEDGPSGDFATTFVRWDGTGFVGLGRVPGKPFWESRYQLVCHGNGAITTRKRACLLHTWHRVTHYRLTADAIVEEPAEFYDMDLDTLVMMNPLPLLASPESTDIIITLHEGERVQLVATDDERWVRIRRERDGREGWIEVERFNYLPSVDKLAHEVFDGLCIAD